MTLVSPRLREGAKDLLDRLAPMKEPAESMGKAKAVEGSEHEQEVARQRGRSQALARSSTRARPERRGANVPARLTVEERL